MDMPPISMTWFFLAIIAVSFAVFGFDISCFTLEYDQLFMSF